MKFTVFSLTLLIFSVSCGDNSYQRKPLRDKIITVQAEKSPNSGDESSDQNSSDVNRAPGSEEQDHSSIIDAILNDNAKTEQLAQKVITELKVFDSKVDVDDQFIAGMVTLIKEATPKTAQDVTDAVFPAIEQLFKDDPKLQTSNIKLLLQASPDIVKSAITTKIEETLIKEEL